MDVGLLWYDDDPKRGITDKVLRAADRYEEKHGRPASLCYVHPTAAAELPELAESHEVSRNGGAPVKVLTAPNVLLHHLWIGEGVIANVET